MKMHSINIICRFREYELEIRIPKNILLFTLTILKMHSLFLYQLLIDICVVDLMRKQNRFVLVYNLLSLKYNQRLRLIIATDHLLPVHSITSLYPAAN